MREVEPVAHQRRARGRGFAARAGASRRRRLELRPRASRPPCRRPRDRRRRRALIASRISFSGDDLPEELALGLVELVERRTRRRSRRRPSRASVSAPLRRVSAAAVTMRVPALAGGLEQQHRAGHRDVQRLARVHRDRDELVERERRRRGPCASWPTHERGRHARGRTASGGGAAGRRPRRCGARRRRRAPPALHRGHALHDPDRETRAGRGAYDLGIVRVDRSRPEDDYRRRRPPPRCGSACRRCRDRRSAGATTQRSTPASPSMPTRGGAATREHGLRRARVADLCSATPAARLAHAARRPLARSATACARPTRRRRR